MHIHIHISRRDRGGGDRGSPRPAAEVARPKLRGAASLSYIYIYI